MSQNKYTIDPKLLRPKEPGCTFATAFGFLQDRGRENAIEACKAMLLTRVLDILYPKRVKDWDELIKDYDAVVEGNKEWMDSWVKDAIEAAEEQFAAGK